MAIDPQRLKLQLAELTALADQPERLLRATLELLELYQVRRRAAGRVQASAPPPVLRGIVRALGSRLQHDPQATERVIVALWGSGRSEARSLAVQLLGEQPTELAPDLVERWTHSAVRLDQMRELAAVGLRGWRRAAPDRFLERCSNWLGSKHRLVGLFALRAAVRDDEFENLPRIYQLAGQLGGNLRGRPRRAMLELLKSMARRAPTETAQFLREADLQGGASMARLIGEVLPSLPNEQRAALRGQNGIIPARTKRQHAAERKN